MQLNMFSKMATFNIEPDLKEAMSNAAKECGLPREKIVAQMNAIARRYGVTLVKGNGENLSEATFEKWMNTNPDTRAWFPSIKALMIFCAVVKDHALKVLNVLVKPLGLLVINEKDVRLLEWAREYHRVRDGQRRMKKLAEQIEE